MQRSADQQFQPRTPAVGPIAPDQPGFFAQSQITLQSGPIPSADALESYERILPGLAERIVGMAEREAKERHWKDRFRLKTERWSVYLSFLLAGGGFGGAGWLIAHGFGAAGITTIIAELASLVLAFRWGKGK